MRKTFSTKIAGRFIAGLALAGIAWGQDASRAGHFHTTIRRAPGIPSDTTTPPSSAITVAEMRGIYGFDLVSNTGEGETIALVLWGNDPRLESDLGTFSTYYGLPPCTTANGCFTKIYSNGIGSTGSPDSGLEESLDVEWAHAIAPGAKLIYVIAPDDPTDEVLVKAVQVAVDNGATVVSMSFGSSETTAFDSVFAAAPGVTFVASAGDSGHEANSPASSPYVVGVGGTTLSHDGGTWTAETAWSCTNTVTCEADGGTGGGLSAIYTEPVYQDPVQNYGKRGIPDVGYDADPNTGVAIYDSYGPGWIQVGGTSMGAPEIAALIAVANSERKAAGKTALGNALPAAVYSVAAEFRDITAGENGNCGAECEAGPGYDLLTGQGTPMANALIPALVALP
jgi:subtilase family serine protease